ncbi:MAG TPA: phosphate ABC transporter permease family protein, partial [Methyloceanibacter sp.]|nr:phosphate ABC transporter permease family protein [Methyloceanibacter sp.]
MSSLAILAVLLATAAVVYFVGRAKAQRQRAAAHATAKQHSRPPYHGAYVAIWTVLPALLLLALWGAAEGPVVRQLIYRDMPASVLERSAA